MQKIKADCPWKCMVREQERVDSRNSDYLQGEELFSLRMVNTRAGT